MMFYKFEIKTIILLFLASSLLGCAKLQDGTPISGPTSVMPTSSLASTSIAQPLSPSFDASKYAFPDSVDIRKKYLFYLHGKIIEDQVIPAISPDYGEYEYQAILEKLAKYGFIVISEPRAKNTDSTEYAKRIKEQVSVLLNSGVPAKNITIIGTSKGAGIAILASHLLENEAVNFVVMAICDPATITELKQNDVSLYGNVLSIYDYADELAGSCQELFSFSEGKGLSKHNEVILNVGTGHGILFKPLDEWITPAIQWAGKP
jgi:hypothetical protein